MDPEGIVYRILKLDGFAVMRQHHGSFWGSIGIDSCIVRTMKSGLEFDMSD